MASNNWNIFHGCDCLKEILQKFGFDQPEYLYGLTESQLNSLEEHIDQNRSMLENFSTRCAHKENYINSDQNFKFLLGHRMAILNFAQRPHQTDSNPSSNEAYKHPAFSTLMQNLIEVALKNHGKSASNNRYSDLVHDFAMYIYIMAGKACYEVISGNLPLPSAVTVVKHIQEHKDRVVEGELRSKQLNTYLEGLGCPKQVFLSEDASGIVQKVVYDVHSNQLIGLVLPLNSTNGMPKMFSFEAKSKEDIENYLELPQSNLVYIVVAQPLIEKAAPFTLLVFGTNNMFDTSDVLNRWVFIESELNKLGIKVVGVSSDGDSRLLKAMMTTMKFGLTPSNIQEISNLMPEVQDTVHMGTKARNRLLNSSIVLYIGNEIVSAVHLEMLIENVSKEVHHLVHSDIIPEDRQNYRSLEKIMEPKVIDALEKNVPDCAGTVMYLKLCRMMTSSYLDDELEPVERVYRIWYALYFLRCWRTFIQCKNNDFTLADNFVSRNLFICVEINAHAMVYLIKNMRDRQEPNLFIPSLFASQPCEFTFRRMRSMGTVNFTKINFNLYELCHLIAKVDLSNKIIYSRKEIKFPRIESKRLKVAKEQAKKTWVLPSDQQIKDTMERARKDAFEMAKKFSMNPDMEAMTHFDGKLLTTLQRGKNADANEDLGEYFSDDDEDYDDVNVIEQLFGLETDNSKTNTVASLSTDPGVNSPDNGSLGSRCQPTTLNAASLSTDPVVNSPDNGNSGSRCQSDSGVKKGFIEIENLDGTKALMRKSTLVWQLLGTNGKLSSDRLKRVQGSSESKRKKRKTVQTDLNVPIGNPILFKSANIEIGEWAIFKIDCECAINRQNSEQYLKENCLLGIVSGFKLINENGKEIQHKSSDAKTTFNEEFKLNLNVLGIWYVCNQNRSLTKIDNKIKIKINIRNYIATMKTVDTKIEKPSENLKYEIPCEFSELAKSVLNQISN